MPEAVHAAYFLGSPSQSKVYNYWSRPSVTRVRMFYFFSLPLARPRMNMLTVTKELDGVHLSAGLSSDRSRTQALVSHVGHEGAAKLSRRQRQRLKRERSEAPTDLTTFLCVFFLCT